jgi:hypothetical protein
MIDKTLLFPQERAIGMLSASSGKAPKIAGSVHVASKPWLTKKKGDAVS